jgi:hypothetical protein
MQATPCLAYKKCRQEDFGEVRGYSRALRLPPGGSNGYIRLAVDGSSGSNCNAGPWQ